jgi:hypothetical protein
MPFILLLNPNVKNANAIYFALKYPFRVKHDALMFLQTPETHVSIKRGYLGWVQTKILSVSFIFSFTFQNVSEKSLCPGGE